MRAYKKGKSKKEFMKNRLSKRKTDNDGIVLPNKKQIKAARKKKANNAGTSE